MAHEDERGDGTLNGTIKWFDPAKGFGFILAEELEEDVLLHANVLRNYGQSSIADGSKITAIFQHTKRGIQAVEILDVLPPKTEGGQLEDMDGLTDEEILALDLIPGRIKWFDKVKGFGFANSFGDSTDIFIHIEVLRRSGLSDLMPGEAVALRVMDGERGKMAAAVHAWEVAQRQETR